VISSNAVRLIPNWQIHFQMDFISQPNVPLGKLKLTRTQFFPCCFSPLNALFLKQFPVAFLRWMPDNHLVFIPIVIFSLVSKKCNKGSHTIRARMDSSHWIGVGDLVGFWIYRVSLPVIRSAISSFWLDIDFIFHLSSQFFDKWWKINNSIRLCYSFPNYLSRCLSSLPFYLSRVLSSNCYSSTK
jgi:hypothetical protein